MGRTSKDSLSRYEIFKNINSSNCEAGLKNGISVHLNKIAFKIKFILYTLVFLMAVCFSFILLCQI